MALTRRAVGRVSASRWVRHQILRAAAAPPSAAPVRQTALHGLVRLGLSNPSFRGRGTSALWWLTRNAVGKRNGTLHEFALAPLLVSLHVPPELVLAVKVAVAPGHGAREASLDFVGAFVLGQVGRLAEAFPTDRALQGFVAGVDTLVHS